MGCLEVAGDPEVVGGLEAVGGLEVVRGPGMAGDRVVPSMTVR